MRLAGLAAIAGAALLFGHLGYGTLFQLQGIAPGWETVGSRSYYLSEGVLFVAWAGMFVGFAAFRSWLLGLESRLWDVGSLLAVVGAALATVGFFVVTVAPAIGALGLVTPGNAVIGLGLMVAITIGSLLMGVALLRTDSGHRVLGVLLVLVLPATLIAGPFGRALGVGPVIALLSIVPFVAAVIVIGYVLGTEPFERGPDGADAGRRS